MKKTGIAFLFLLCLTGILSAQSLPRVTIVNDTGYTIYFIFISQTATDEWEEDVLDDDVLMDGESISVSLAYPLNVTNRYDIKVEDEDGDTYIKWDVLITPDAEIVFTLDDLVLETDF